MTGRLLALKDLGPVRHHPFMAKQKSALERIQFLAAPGTRGLYARAAELEGLEPKYWMRRVLHAEALRLLEAHGLDVDSAPAAQPTRPPRLQPRGLYQPPDEPAGSETS